MGSIVKEKAEMLKAETLKLLVIKNT
jgi:hypothetical protein